MITKLLDKDFNNRIGFEDILDLKQHDFFEGINFEKLYQMDPPFSTMNKGLTSPVRLHKVVSYTNLKKNMTQINKKITQNDYKSSKRSNSINNPRKSFIDTPLIEGMHIIKIRNS